MNFERLLHVARKNELHKKEPVKCLQTKFKPPTKEQKEKDRALSEGVQRFLARKEEEEKKKKKEEARKREELAALRAKDPKANKRINTMLKRTKSANKSVMDDIDYSNTADTLAGPSQPDEDDYGFVSETSSALYNKLIQKMYSTPSNDTPKFAPSKKPSSGNLLNTKERVKMALLKQEEDEKLPHKRKRRKREEGGGGDDNDEELNFGAPDRNVDTSSKTKPAEKPKPKRPPAPPPMDFMDLLRLAEKKQHEPVVIEPKVKQTEPEQLMTKKQREEHRKLEELRRQKEARFKALERGEKPPDTSSEKPAIKRIPKIGQSSSEVRISKSNLENNTKSGSEKTSSSEKSSQRTEQRIPKTDSKPNRSLEPSRNGLSKPSGSSKSSLDRIPKKVESETEKLKRERDDALRVLKEKEEAFKLLEEKERLMRERDEALARLKQIEEKEAKAKMSKPSESRPSLKAPETKKPLQKPAIREFPPKDLKRPEPSKSGREFPPKDVRRPEPPKGVRQFPPKDVRRPETTNGVRQFPPKDVRRPDTTNGIRQFPPKDVKRANGRPMTKEEIVRKRLAELKRRKIEDSEEEYDSELDDFIVDEPDPGAEKEDISAVISQIFKYDKNKYSKYDDDGECMESNWAQISKEEYISTKCGMMEDLEDMKAEKAALARKKQKR